MQTVALIFFVEPRHLFLECRKDNIRFILSCWSVFPQSFLLQKETTMAFQQLQQLLLYTAHKQYSLFTKIATATLRHFLMAKQVTSQALWK